MDNFDLKKSLRKFHPLMRENNNGNGDYNGEDDIIYDDFGTPIPKYIYDDAGTKIRLREKLGKATDILDAGWEFADEFGLGKVEYT